MKAELEATTRRAQEHMSQLAIKDPDI
jgi:hypothetical protein